MITETIINVLFGVAGLIIKILPQISLDTLGGVAGLETILAYALFFFPLDIWLIGIANGLMFMGGAVGYSCIEWVYKKIPGVD